MAKMRIFHDLPYFALICPVLAHICLILAYFEGIYLEKEKNCHFRILKGN